MLLPNRSIAPYEWNKMCRYRQQYFAFPRERHKGSSISRMEINSKICKKNICNHDILYYLKSFITNCFIQMLRRDWILKNRKWNEPNLDGIGTGIKMFSPKYRNRNSFSLQLYIFNRFLDLPLQFLVSRYLDLMDNELRIAKRDLMRINRIKLSKVREFSLFWY